MKRRVVSRRANWAAQFKYACQTDEDNRALLILDLDAKVIDTERIVPLDMPVHQNLRFIQRHLIDVQMVAKAWLEAGLALSKQEMDMSVT